MKEIVKRIILLILSALLIFTIYQINTVQAASDNANLAVLGYQPEDFTGFKADITTYDTTVPYNIRTIEVYAKTQDSSATYVVTGNTNLEVGKNVITVKVTAGDGVTTKTYTMNVTREENEMHIGISDEEIAAQKEAEKKKEEEEKRKAQEKAEREARVYSEPHTQTGWIIMGVVLFVMTAIFIAMIIIGRRNK